jgi:hypothetical protein
MPKSTVPLPLILDGYENAGTTLTNLGRADKPPRGGKNA